MNGSFNKRNVYYFLIRISSHTGDTLNLDTPLLWKDMLLVIEQLRYKIRKNVEFMKSRAHKINPLHGGERCFFLCINSYFTTFCLKVPRPQPLRLGKGGQDNSLIPPQDIYEVKLIRTYFFPRSSSSDQKNYCFTLWIIFCLSS